MINLLEINFESSKAKSVKALSLIINLVLFGIKKRKSENKTLGWFWAVRMREYLRVQVKKVISKNATVGVYYWKKGSDYVNCAETMIKKNIRVNNEFYVCPVYNEAIGEGKKIVIDKVSEMHGLGTPDDLKNFITKKNLVN